ncbi:M23 family metallopeptidase [Bacillus sp. 165]|uniref:murein hydrolase activator EnvC family protein n=1 Tax=Bacillus sp. 165 TaxID=1529117 RepID=UPI001ADAE111|nr:M23 family metallopeptidase [Bacillus sp. 165]MBO9128336.1 peptidoglycan DD-metalloendopeptidase family protein [Bacillus sp. 165]
MNKKITFCSLFTASILLASPVIPYANAQSNQQKLNNIQDQLKDKEMELHTKQSEKEQLQSEITALQQVMKELDHTIAKNQEALDKTGQETQILKATIEEKKHKIEELHVRIANRQDLLRQRLTVLQEQSRTNLVTEVLVNAKNIVDFIQNIYSINLIMNSDTAILKEQQQDQKQLKKEMKSLQEKQQALIQHEIDLKEKQKELTVQQKQKDDIVKQLEAKLATTEGEMQDTTETKAILEAQKEMLQQTMQEESSPSVKPGGFIKPASGTITSEFGGRWGKHHDGIDIAQSGSVPVIAAASGTVIRSYYSSSYGNVVFIAHLLNGKTYISVYAHLRDRSVSAGQAVKQGQQIGIMGNTGHSFGQHLHFELHAGEWNQAKSNAVDPLRYIQ